MKHVNEELDLRAFLELRKEGGLTVWQWIRELAGAVLGSRLNTRPTAVPPTAPHARAPPARFAPRTIRGVLAVATCCRSLAPCGRGLPGQRPSAATTPVVLPRQPHARTDHCEQLRDHRRHRDLEHLVEVMTVEHEQLHVGGRGDRRVRSPPSISAISPKKETGTKLADRGRRRPLAIVSPAITRKISSPSSPCLVSSSPACVPRGLASAAMRSSSSARAGREKPRAPEERDALVVVGALGHGEPRAAMARPRRRRRVPTTSAMPNTTAAMPSST